MNESYMHNFYEDRNTEFYFVMALKDILKQRIAKYFKMNLVAVLGWIIEFLGDMKKKDSSFASLTGPHSPWTALFN